MNSWVLAQWILLFASVFVFAFFARFRFQSIFHKAYLLISLFGFIWALGQHAENTLLLYYPDEQYYYGALLICYFGMCMLGPSCVYMAWCYSGKFKLYQNTKYVAMLFATGIFFYLIILTNDMHHLYYLSFTIGGRTYAALYYVFTAFSYLCFGYAYVTMQQAEWDAHGKTPPLLLLCFLPPVLANTVGMIVKNPLLDFTPFAYFLMHMGTLLSILLYRPINLVPIAAKKVLDNLGHPLWVEREGNILYANNQTEALSSLPTDTGRYESDGAVYRTSHEKLQDGNSLFSLTDVTNFERALHTLETQNEELSSVQAALERQRELLQDYASSANDLAAEKKRAEIMLRLGRETEDMLSALHANIEDCIACPDAKKITSGIQLSTQALDTVRRIINEFKRKTV